MSGTDPGARLVVITGVGFREAAPVASSCNIFTSLECKPNIGAAVALACVRAGFSVVAVARTKEKLERVCRSVNELEPTASIQFHAADILNAEDIRQFAADLPQYQQIDVVHCAGLSAGSYSLPDDNPYLSAARTPPELAVLEFEAVVKSLLILVQAFLPSWRRQEYARLVVVSSMSGIRAFPLGFSHASAKGGLHLAVRSLALELAPLRIYVSEIQPGMVNTGLYDSPAVADSVRKIGRTFGYEYGPEPLPQMSSVSVANAVTLCLSSDAHVLSVAMVSRGQFPHLGS